MVDVKEIFPSFEAVSVVMVRFAPKDTAPVKVTVFPAALLVVISPLSVMVEPVISMVFTSSAEPIAPIETVPVPALIVKSSEEFPLNPPAIETFPLAVLITRSDPLLKSNVAVVNVTLSAVVVKVTVDPLLTKIFCPEGAANVRAFDL